jgi:hypothetical protein
LGSFRALFAFTGLVIIQFSADAVCGTGMLGLGLTLLLDWLVATLSTTPATTPTTAGRLVFAVCG